MEKVEPTQNPATSTSSYQSASNDTVCKKMKNNEIPSYPHPSLRGQRYVLFPHDRYIQHWDNFFLCVLIYYCFSVPYTVGVSGGYWMYMNTGWFVFNMVLNLVYIVDTVMLFFRAYYDDNGLLVYDLRRIARHYVVSGQFFLNLLASFPMQLIIFLLDRKYEDRDIPLESWDVNLLVIASLLRLLRIPRVSILFQTSIAFTNWWERQDVPKAMLASFIFKLVLVAHWIACFWSFFAFIQVWSFGRPLGEEANWISNWYDSSYVEGGIDPIGWGNDTDRYALALFWSIQSITSIGYGNIVPVTRLEYYFANILMLLSGLFWAFTIGNLVSIVEHMNSRRNHYKRKLDKANNMIKCFSQCNDGESREQSDIGVGDSKAIAFRIRQFVSSQYYGDRLNSPEKCNTSSLDNIFPVLRGFSPELRKLSSLHLMRKYFEMIPYLSSKYLSPDEQSNLSFKCYLMEFARGEAFARHPEFGRGIMIPRRGMVLSVGSEENHGVDHEDVSMRMYGIDDPISVNEVLVEESFLEDEIPLYRFVSYSVVVYIPQSAIYEVLNAKKRAWKLCARWKYLQACLVKWAKETNGTH